MKDVLDLFKGQMPDIQGNYDEACKETKKEEIKLGVVPDEKCEVYGDDTVEDLLEGLDIQNGGGNTPQPQPVPPTPPTPPTPVTGPSFIIDGEPSSDYYPTELTPVLDTLVWNPGFDYEESTCEIRVDVEMVDHDEGGDLATGTYQCYVRRFVDKSGNYGYYLYSEDFQTTGGRMESGCKISVRYSPADNGYTSGWYSDAHR